MKIPPVEADLFHADGRTDRRDESNSSFSGICESAQNRLSPFQSVHCVLYNTLFVYSSGSKHVGSRHPAVRAYVPKRLHLLEWDLRIHVASQTVLFLQPALVFHLMSFVITFIMNKMWSFWDSISLSLRILSLNEAQKYNCEYVDGGGGSEFFFKVQKGSPL
jgi:hypothetical protein